MGRPKLPTPEKYCEICGKRMERRPRKCRDSITYETVGEFEKRRFCSNACSSKFKSMQALKTPAPTAKQSRVRARNSVPKSACAICGKEGYTEVHHVDKNPMNNSPDNLVRLCKSCHAKQHRERKRCIICGLPAKGHNLCTKHWQAWRKSVRRGWDTEYTASIKRAMADYNNEQNG